MDMAMMLGSDWKCAASELLITCMVHQPTIYIATQMTYTATNQSQGNGRLLA